ncbi:MAG: hypothetical protein JNM19_06365 [Chitinophagaceae bacterium]|nr:hypothetical protein [Chitinophagaceae bacterium]
MSIFDFFRRKRKVNQDIPDTGIAIDQAQWTGKDFDFLIKGDIEISPDMYDKIMTPDSFEWIKIVKDDWTYYQVGQDEYSYSWEIPGIQMTFNESIPFHKAKQIANQVVEKIRATGQDAQLVILDKLKIQSFD